MWNLDIEVEKDIEIIDMTVEEKFLLILLIKDDIDGIGMMRIQDLDTITIIVQAKDLGLNQQDVRLQ